MPPVIVVTGFEPFGKERINPSWEVARSMDGDLIGGLRVKSVRLPVSCVRGARRVATAVVRYRPRAVLGLGQARGRPALSLERIAINLFEQRNGGQLDARDGGRPLIPGGPAAYFSRLPMVSILKALAKREVPVSISLSAGVYACNAAMYAALHALRRRPSLPAGFIHLPFDASQSARDPMVPSMPLPLMKEAIRIAISVIAKETLPASARRAAT